MPTSTVGVIRWPFERWTALYVRRADRHIVKHSAVSVAAMTRRLADSVDPSARSAIASPAVRHTAARPMPTSSARRIAAGRPVHRSFRARESIAAPMPTPAAVTA